MMLCTVAASQVGSLFWAHLSLSEVMGLPVSETLAPFWSSPAAGSRSGAEAWDRRGNRPLCFLTPSSALLMDLGRALAAASSVPCGPLSR